jgi:hypothetical protein
MKTQNWSSRALAAAATAVLFVLPAKAKSPQPNSSGHADDMHTYLYVHDDPTDKTDPSGKESCQGPPCPDISPASSSVVNAALATHQSVAPNIPETGAQIMVDKNDRGSVTEIRENSDAGHNDPSNPMKFVFNKILPDDKSALGGDVHPHPMQVPSDKSLAAKAAADKANTRNLYPSGGDYHHMNQTGALCSISIRRAGLRKPIGQITSTTRSKLLQESFR